MRSFWGYYENEDYHIGCNGATVYVYDSKNNELARFKDVTYAYVAKFMPDSDTIVVKTTIGSLAIYSLKKLKLIKKIYITKVGAQDGGFSFSPDGKYLYNIESPQCSTKTQLTKYDTADFEVVERLFVNNDDMVLDDIEFDKTTSRCYILGFMRDSSTGVYDYGFVGELVKNNIEGIKKLDRKTYDYVEAYKSWELAGFTKKAREWSSLPLRLRDVEKIVPITLKELFEANGDILF